MVAQVGYAGVHASQDKGHAGVHALCAAHFGSGMRSAACVHENQSRSYRGVWQLVGLRMDSFALLLAAQGGAVMPPLMTASATFLCLCLTFVDSIKANTASIVK